MIYSNIKYKNNYDFLPKLIKKTIEFAKNNDLLNFEKGSYPILDKDLYVNIAEYETTSRENRFWEAHIDYLDLHLILKGEELIDVALLDHVKTGEYKKEDDYLEITGAKGSTIHMQEGDFLICNPEEAHQTGVMLNHPLKIKKAIFKIKKNAL